MSACGVLWTAYLSYASANAVGKVPPPPPPPPKKKLPFPLNYVPFLNK